MRQLYVSVERRYKLFADKYYVQGIENVGFFERYLDCFDNVKVIARVEKVDFLPENHELFEHDNIKIQPLLTSGTGLSSLSDINRIASLITADNSFVILRTPGILAYLLSLVFIVRSIKFSIEVVTNPVQETNHLTNNLLLKAVFRIIFINIFKLQLRKTRFASFVTRFEIQQVFLSNNQVSSPRFDSNYSSVSLTHENYADEKLLNARINRYSENDTKTLLFMGVLDRDFKGLDIFLKLMADLPENYNAIVVGDGVLLPQYKMMARELEISSRIDFRGYISSPEKKKEIMAEADFFILTSRREGLPRVVIEAMASGLPCLCSAVSGVRELVNEKYIFAVNDFKQAKQILTNISKAEYEEMSKKNHALSYEYNYSKLSEKRKSFYLKVISSENTTFK